MEYYTATERNEWTIGTCYNMVHAEPWKHYAQGKKSDVWFHLHEMRRISISIEVRE